MLPSVTYVPGAKLNVRFEAVGTNPTTLRMKAWPAANTEPTAWQLTATDNTSALQTAGSVGIRSYLSGSATNAPVTASVTAFSARPSAAAPTAAFTPACSALACTVDASASTDPNGAISSYSWSFGDGAVATGKTSSHTFAAAATYRITLTVTNTFGWTDVTTRTVTVP